MNKTIVTVILLVACIGMGTALVIIKNKGSEQQRHDADAILNFSNQLAAAQDQISGLNQVNVLLTNDLAVSRETSSALSNQLDQAIDQAKASAMRARQEIGQVQQQITNLNRHISLLEAQNAHLERSAASLTNRIMTLDKQIAVTEASLSQSKTNNTFLENELKKQVAERTALEQRFNSLAAMRAQFHKLKDDAFMATRLRWMREGTDPSQQIKGAQLLTRSRPAPVVAAPENNALNVEVEAGGAVRVVPPTNSAGTGPTR